MAAPQKVTLLEMETLSHAVNQIGADRCRWNTPLTVEDIANPGVLYVSKTLGAPWLRMGSKPGFNDSSWIIVPV